MARRVLSGLGLVVALGLVPAVANASTIAANCGSCGSHNTAFNITYSLDSSSTATNKIYDFVVTAVYGSTVDYTYLNDFAFKFDSLSKDSDYTSTPAVVSAPSGDTWTVLGGGISNSSGSGDCDGSGGGFWCVNSAGLGVKESTAGTSSTWTLTLDIGNQTLSSTGETGSFKAGFTDGTGHKVGSLISEDVTFTPCTANCGSTSGTVPEPVSMVLFGTGLAGLAYRRLRRS